VVYIRENTPEELVEEATEYESDDSFVVFDGDVSSMEGAEFEEAPERRKRRRRVVESSSGEDEPAQKRKRRRRVVESSSGEDEPAQKRSPIVISSDSVEWLTTRCACFFAAEN